MRGPGYERAGGRRGEGRLWPGVVAAAGLPRA